MASTPPVRNRGNWLVIVVVIATGGLLSLQAFVNGQLAVRLGSPFSAVAVSSTIATAVLTVIAMRRRSLVPGLAALMRNRSRRPWYLTAGVLGAALVVASSYAAPIVGVAVLTVAVVCGQLIGGLAVDAFGLVPGKRRRPTATRLCGALLAIVAVTLGAVGGAGHLHLLLSVLLAAAGFGFAVQQAAMGQLTKIMGEPAVAAALVFLTSMVVTLPIGVATAGTESLDITVANPVWLTGGLMGAAIGVVLSAAVGRIGVVQQALGLVAGQSLAGLLIDLAVPASRSDVGVLTVVGVMLTLVAVAIANRPVRDG